VTGRIPTRWPRSPGAAAVAAEFRADGEVILLHLNGEPKPPLGFPGDVRGVRTAKLRGAIFTALDHAVRDGAAFAARYGPEDGHQSLAAILRGQPPRPGELEYTCRREGRRWHAVRIERATGAEQAVVSGPAPFWVAGDVVSCLQRAFNVGRRFGHPAVDGLARPLPCRDGVLLFAVAIERDRVLGHWPATHHRIAYNLHGTQITARIAAPGQPDTFTVFRRYDGAGRATDGHQFSGPDSNAKWKQVTDELTPAQLEAWDGRDMPDAGHPDSRVTAWLNQTATLRPATVSAR
jgi:hypothetical protein